MSLFSRFLILLIISVTNVTMQDPDCSLFRSWEDARYLNLGHLWFEKSSQLGYSQAKQFCEARQSNLIEIDSKDQMDYIVGKLNSFGLGGDGWWGGATDEQREGTWRWPKSGQSVQSFVWGRVSGDCDITCRCQEPNSCGGDEDYFSFYRANGYKGADFLGSLSLYPLCQQKRYEMEYQYLTCNLLLMVF